MVQFGAIIFCITFKNYFGQFVWIEKKSHYISRVSLHEAPTNKKYFHVMNTMIQILESTRWNQSKYSNIQVFYGFFSKKKQH